MSGSELSRSIFQRDYEMEAEVAEHKSKPLPSPVIPTDSRRHMTKIRMGRLDTSQVFSKERLAEIPVDSDAYLEEPVKRSRRRKKK